MTTDLTTEYDRAVYALADELRLLSYLCVNARDVRDYERLNARCNDARFALHHLGIANPFDSRDNHDPRDFACNVVRTPPRPWRPVVDEDGWTVGYTND